ncbi:MAG TPA: class I SAM-dependent methyltransferase [Chthonomonadaceae bacterium]|nr:class I SAM-dependent methyltransferase [Chthonomonadaceae bacterium]
MSNEYPDPSALMQLATGYWNSATLLAANELRLFDLLAQSSRPADEIARALNADLSATTRLLDACVGLQLLTKEGSDGRALYSNTPVSAAFLVAGRPGYLGSAIAWGADQYSAWGRLSEAVRQGKPVLAPALHLGDDPEQTRTFVLGMYHRALGVARGVLHFLDLSGVRTLLDVGGGPGAYAMLLAQKYPDLHATVLDLPGIVRIAAELIAEAGLTERVGVHPGDATQDDYGDAEFDAVLFSGVLHQMSGPTIQAMLRRAYRALKSGGRVLISDMMVDSTRTQPLFSALFSLQMLLSSAEGAVFSADDMREWLGQAGFEDVGVQRLPPPLPYEVIHAVK